MGLVVLLSVASVCISEASEVAIGGYSPVAYFTEGRALLGDVEFSVSHGGKTYFMRNAAEAERFRADPDRYVPRYNVCPYSLAHGKQLPIDPTNFRIVGGYLLLFHKSEMADGLAAFKASGLTDDELIERADKAFTLLRF